MGHDKLKEENPYAPSAFGLNGKRKVLRYRYVYLLFLTLWPVMSISAQIVDGLARDFLGLGELNLFVATARSLSFQLAYLGLGSVACIIAAVHERLCGRSIALWEIAALSIIGAVVVMVEITVFHPPSA